MLAVAPARMRNILYPRSQAAYMTAAEVKRAVASEMVMETDGSFGTGKQVQVKNQQQVSYDMKGITVSACNPMLLASSLTIYSLNELAK